jgi:hypothetical protein
MGRELFEKYRGMEKTAGSNKKKRLEDLLTKGLQEQDPPSGRVLTLAPGGIVKGDCGGQE